MRFPWSTIIIDTDGAIVDHISFDDNVIYPYKNAILVGNSKDTATAYLTIYGGSNIRYKGIRITVEKIGLVLQGVCALVSREDDLALMIGVYAINNENLWEGITQEHLKFAHDLLDFSYVMLTHPSSYAAIMQRLTSRMQDFN